MLLTPNHLCDLLDPLIFHLCWTLSSLSFTEEPKTGRSTSASPGRSRQTAPPPSTFYTPPDAPQDTPGHCRLMGSLSRSKPASGCGDEADAPPARPGPAEGGPGDELIRGRRRGGRRSRQRRRQLGRLAGPAGPCVSLCVPTHAREPARRRGGGRRCKLFLPCASLPPRPLLPAGPAALPARSASCEGGAAGSDRISRPCLSLQTKWLCRELREQWRRQHAKQ